MSREVAPLDAVVDFFGALRRRELKRALKILLAPAAALPRGTALARLDAVHRDRDAAAR